MKFVKDLPNKDGYYWLIDIEYPLPKIVWYSNYYKKFWDWGIEREFSIRSHRFGDKIEEPHCKDNEYD